MGANNSRGLDNAQITDLIDAPIKGASDQNKHLSAGEDHQTPTIGNSKLVNELENLVLDLPPLEAPDLGNEIAAKVDVSGLEVTLGQKDGDEVVRITNAFKVKNQLKLLGFRWESETKAWWHFCHGHQAEQVNLLVARIRSMSDSGKEKPPEVSGKESKFSCVNLNYLRDLSVHNTTFSHRMPIVSYFSNLEAALIGHIRQATYLVGCVAWLSHRSILRELAAKQVALIVDVHLPDSKKIRPLYDALRPLNETKVVGFQPRAISVLGANASGNVCGTANISSLSKIAPHMHHKFLVFINEEFIPYGVWTGSFNFTVNATRSLENAVFIAIEAEARKYLQEWQQLYPASTVIRWET